MTRRDEEIERVVALRREGKREEHLSAALELAAKRPSEVRARIEAAYALDRCGDEAGAVRHYDAAWRMGIPGEQRKRFVVGYGSTLRNVGRVEEAVVILAEEIEKEPGYPAHAAFLALALHSAGHGSAALATMLGCVLDVARGGEALDGYERALGESYRALIDESTRGRR